MFAWRARACIPCPCEHAKTFKSAHWHWEQSHLSHSWGTSAFRFSSCFSSSFFFLWPSWALSLATAVQVAATCPLLWWPLLLLSTCDYMESTQIIKVSLYFKIKWSATFLLATIMPFAVWYNTYVFVLSLLPSLVYTHCPQVQQERAGYAVSRSGNLELTSFRLQQHVTYCSMYVLKMESELLCNCTSILCLPWESLVLKQD